MHIKLRFFASLRERLGRSEDSCEVPEGATSGQSGRRSNKSIRPSSRLSVRSPLRSPRNMVDGDHPLHDNDELAFIPPVSGGVPTDSRLSCRITQDPIRLDELTAFVADPGGGRHGNICRHDPRHQ